MQFYLIKHESKHADNVFFYNLNHYKIKHWDFSPRTEFWDLIGTDADNIFKVVPVLSESPAAIIIFACMWNTTGHINSLNINNAIKYCNSTHTRKTQHIF